MVIPAWKIASWPTVEWYLPHSDSGWPVFWHMSSSVSSAYEASLKSGETMWITDLEGRRAAVAWNWVEVSRGVVVLTDPNGIVSNIRFTDEYSEPVEHLAATICMTRIAHRLAWQAEVRALLAHTRAGSRPVLWHDSLASVQRSDRSVAQFARKSSLAATANVL